MIKQKRYVAPCGNNWAVVGRDRNVISVHPTHRKATAAALKHPGVKLIFSHEPVTIPKDEIGIIRDGQITVRKKAKGHFAGGEKGFREILYPTLPPEIDEDRLKAAVKTAMAQTLPQWRRG